MRHAVTWRSAACSMDTTYHSDRINHCLHLKQSPSIGARKKKDDRKKNIFLIAMLFFERSSIAMLTTWILVDFSHPQNCPFHFFLCLVRYQNGSVQIKKKIYVSTHSKVCDSLTWLSQIYTCMWRKLLSSDLMPSISESLYDYIITNLRS